MRIIRDMAQKSHNEDIPRACQRAYPWGKHLFLAVDSTGVGLKQLVESISVSTGGLLGGRTTFAKLYDLHGPPFAATREYDRAYALLLCIGEDPKDWGVDEDLVSEVLKRSRDLLIRTSRCIALSAA